MLAHMTELNVNQLQETNAFDEERTTDGNETGFSRAII